MSDAATAEVVPAKKSGASMLVIILSALLAAGAAGGGVYFFTASKGQDTAASEEAAGAKAKAKVPKGPAAYVKLDPPFVANFEAKGQNRFLQVSVEVMTRDPATADLIKLHDPMIRNDLLMLFGNQQYENISTREGKDKLRLEALNLVGKVIAAEGGDAKKVEQLYFTSFVMQ